MTKKLIAFAALVATGLLFPDSARAEGGMWELLEKLSGPGKFYGFVLDAPIGCMLVDKPKDPDNKAWVFGEQCWNRKFVRGDPQVRATKGGFSWNRRYSLGLYFGYFGTDKNNLDYADPTQAVGVRWIKLGPRFTWHATKFIDLRTSIDINRLSSKDRALNNFDDIWLGTIEPVGVVITPFSRSDSFWQFVAISIRPQIMLKSLDAQMFGANPEELEGAGALHWQVGVRINPWPNTK